MILKKEQVYKPVCAGREFTGWGGRGQTAIVDVVDTLGQEAFAAMHEPPNAVSVLLHAHEFACLRGGRVLLADDVVSSRRGLVRHDILVVTLQVRSHTVALAARGTGVEGQDATRVWRGAAVNGGHAACPGPREGGSARLYARTRGLANG